MPSFDATGLLLTTVKVIGERAGTGFLLFREIEKGKGKVFVITNKHVLHESPVIRGAMEHVGVVLNHRVGAELTCRRWDISLRPHDLLVREHPDADTDVLAIDITVAYNELEQRGSPAEVKWVTSKDLADETVLRDEAITECDEILTAGYPLELQQGRGVLPLVRSGMIATDPGGSLLVRKDDDTGASRIATLRAFLIDGAVIPGSSGSPVFLRPVFGRRVGKNLRMPSHPYVLGILSRGAKTPIDIVGLDKGAQRLDWWSGLGLVFRAETVRETVDLFFPEATPAATPSGAAEASRPEGGTSAA